MFVFFPSKLKYVCVFWRPSALLSCICRYFIYETEGLGFDANNATCCKQKQYSRASSFLWKQTKAKKKSWRVKRIKRSSAGSLRSVILIEQRTEQNSSAPLGPKTCNLWLIRDSRHAYPPHHQQACQQPVRHDACHFYLTMAVRDAYGHMVNVTLRLLTAWTFCLISDFYTVVRSMKWKRGFISHFILSSLGFFPPCGRHLLYIAATSRRRTTSYPLVSSELLL